ncbi:MAG TPA: hypothetical protein VFB38_11580 [Chthonomonadaceae bacterium]|nr:hypothetical protein [Chthonomonadaceae bacterium]
MTTYERAIQIYQVLICAARNRQILTYELLGKLIGVPAFSLGSHLEHLLCYFKDNNLPPLTVLVGLKSGGKPGSGMTSSQGPDADREKVYAHNWFAMPPITSEKNFKNKSVE